MEYSYQLQNFARREVEIVDTKTEVGEKLLEEVFLKNCRIQQFLFIENFV